MWVQLAYSELLAHAPVQPGPALLVPVLLCDAALASMAGEGKGKRDFREEICISTCTRRQKTRIFPPLQLLFSAVSIFLPSMY